MCPKSGKKCSGSCSDDDYEDADASDDNGEEDFVHVNMDGAEIIQSSKHSPIHINLKGAQWIKVTKMNEIFEIFDKIGYVAYVLIGGNTAHGKSTIANVDIVNIITYRMFPLYFAGWFLDTEIREIVHMNIYPEGRL
jgi:hypothetical protein